MWYNSKHNRGIYEPTLGIPATNRERNDTNIETEKAEISFCGM